MSFANGLVIGLEDLLAAFARNLCRLILSLPLYA